MQPVFFALVTLEFVAVGFVKERITNVFTFGAPPIAAHSDPNRIVSDRTLDDKAYCGILDAFGLEGDFVQSFIQPWDPISRLFSELDALYPLVEDLGDDGKVNLMIFVFVTISECFCSPVYLTNILIFH